MIFYAVWPAGRPGDFPQWLRCRQRTELQAYMSPKGCAELKICASGAKYRQTPARDMHLCTAPQNPKITGNHVFVRQTNLIGACGLVSAGLVVWCVPAYVSHATRTLSRLPPNDAASLSASGAEAEEIPASKGRLAAAAGAQV